MSLIEATTVKLLDNESKIETTLKIKKEESWPSGTWIGKEIIRFLFLSRSAFTVVHGNEIFASIDGPRRSAKIRSMSEPTVSTGAPTKSRQQRESL